MKNGASQHPVGAAWFRCACSFILAVLLAPATLQAAPAANAAAVSPEQRKAYESIVREYLLSNPAVIRDAMQALQQQEETQKQQQAALALKEHRAELLQDPDSPVGGNPMGDVSVVQFFDYQCGYCKKVAPSIEALIARDSNVRVVFKEFPILGGQSMTAARAALAAQRQGKYLEFHHALMAVETNDDASIQAAAEKVGLDSVALHKDMLDPVLNELLDRNYRLATALGINGTPAFIIGDRVVPGAASADALLLMVNMERLQQKNAAAAPPPSAKVGRQ